MADTEPTTPAPGQEPTGEVTEPNVDDPNADQDEDGNELPVEVLRDRLTRANKQAAAERVKRQELAAELDGLKTRAAETKTPEEVEALMSEYEAKVKKANEESDRIRAAYAAGLPEELVDRVKGDDYEAMFKDAQFLAELATASQKEPRTPGGGRTPHQDPGDPEPGSGYRAAKAKHTY